MKAAPPELGKSLGEQFGDGVGGSWHSPRLCLQAGKGDFGQEQALVAAGFVLMLALHTLMAR